MADDFIRIEYSQTLQPLKELLSSVTRPGDFFVNSTLEIPMPKIEVDEVGVLSFPVPPSQIEALIQHSARAPYGRGPETMLDESVRKVWQIAADKVYISGKSWGSNLETVFRKVAGGLGCDFAQISAELYKLLVYDVGGFFLPHRDTEKAGGMFGTMIVVLPSAHCGGELVIHHAGREVTVDMSQGEFSEISFAAFYADCEHEVRPIREGHRVCLVYNLIHKPLVRGQAPLISPPNYEEQIGGAGTLLREALCAPEAPIKVAWLLEHQYSPEGLSFAGLKSTDAPVVNVLTKAAERAGCVAHLGIVRIEESGAAQPEYRGGWHGRRDEDDDFEIIEIDDWRHYISQWRNQRDEPVAFGEIPLAPGELLPEGALDDAVPDEQRLLEASGNEGASFERSYHRAALVIWHRERYAEVLLQAGVEAALPYLENCIEVSESNPQSQDARNAASEVARLLVDAWGSESPRTSGFLRRKPAQRDVLLLLLARLGDLSLLESLISGVLKQDYEGIENKALLVAAQTLGPEKTGFLYAELVRSKMPSLPSACVDLLHTLTFQKQGSAESAWRSALFQIAEAAILKIEEIKSPGSVYDPAPQKSRAVTPDFVARLLNSLGKISAAGLRTEAVRGMAKNHHIFDPVTVLVPAIALIDELDLSVTQLWEHAVAFLLDRSAFPPRTPTDWSQKMTRTCSCADCTELENFASNPIEQMHRFRMREDRRQHLQNIITSLRMDLDTATDRKGTPQTLVCTKNRHSYRTRCKQYRNEIAALRTLSEFAAEIESAPSVERIKAAIARAEAYREI